MNKYQFLKSEFWILSWNGSVQRNSLYCDGSSDYKRKQFRREVICWLDGRMIPRYRNSVNGEQHKSHIQELCDQASAVATSQVLGADRYHLAAAQKLLNLQLKYLWCAGKIAEPPHCPIDRIVLRAAECNDNWTGMREMKQYENCIEAIRAKADEANKSIARWELDIYKRRF